MHIKINRDECPAGASEVSDCIRCVERYLTEPLNYERHCLRVSEQRHVSTITVTITAENEVPVVFTDDEIWPYVRIEK